MPFKSNKTKLTLFLSVLLLITTAASCSPPWVNRTIDFEFTGQVLDHDTKQPIEGAYVLAVYEKVDSAFAVGTVRYCVKTKGMLSDNEGKFHFPIDKLDGNSPHIALAIKQDYFLHTMAIPSDAVWKAQTKETYSNRHVFLKKQVPGAPEYAYGLSTCQRPESREAAAANVQAYKIEREEYIRLGRGDSSVRNVDSIIQRLEATINSAPSGRN